MRDPKEFTDTDGTILYEFDAQVGNGTVLEGQGSTLAQKYSVTVAKVVDGSSLEYRVVRFLSNDNRSMAPVSFRDKADFTGTVYYYGLKGRTERLEGYKDGALKAVSGDIGKSGTSIASRVPKDCLPDDPYCDGGFFIYEPVSHYTDWYNVRGNRLDYSHSTYEYTSYIKVWVPSNGGGAPARNYHDHLDAPAPHGPGGTGHASNHPTEIIKDPSIIGTKAECVFEKLNKSSSGFKKVIKKFDEKFPVVHLKFSIKNLPDGVNGKTSNLDTYLIEISLNKNNIANRPVLAIARTLIHESIHAEMYRKVRSVGGNISINDFPGIYDYYRRYVKNWQHEQMAAHYRKTIKDQLKEFDGNKNSDALYNALAWTGLSGTTTWNQLTNKERQDIKKINDDFEILGKKTCEK